MKMLNIDDLLGAKFVNHGRSIKDGFDCYGLAIEVSKRLGHTLGDLWYKKACPETFSDNAESILHSLSEQLEETSEQCLGNLIIFADSQGRMVHIGVLLEEGRFIHADIGGVRVTELDSYYRKDWRIYKWRQ